MRLAIISDIHGNLEAFQAVLADIDATGVDSMISLGDNIGYGPEPEEVVKLLRKLGIPSIMGNHELALAQPRYLDLFNPMSRENLLQTQKLLFPETREYLTGLPPFLVKGPCRLVHGCPPDSIITYLFEISDHDLGRRLAELPEKICFVGHTHQLQLGLLDDTGASRSPLPKGELALDKGTRYLINVGGVGQPRDGNPDAKYVIFDQEAMKIEVRFVPYDAEVTAAKIIKRGFAEYYADRLCQTGQGNT